MFIATIAAVTAGKLRRGTISSVPTGANISQPLLSYRYTGLIDKSRISQGDQCSWASVGFSRLAKSLESSQSMKSLQDLWPEPTSRPDTSPEPDPGGLKSSEISWDGFA